MTRTPISGLVAAFVFSAAAMAIVTWGFYGSFSTIPVMVSATLWIMAIFCLVLTYVVKDRRKEGLIGLDRSQLNPMMVTNFLLIGKASAWTGAVVGGGYAGIGTYVIPNLSMLAAAQADLPGVLSSAAGGIALAVAGIILERACEVSPPADGESIG
ncbi:DUF3180 domain-containing protein [Corynebacterium breve]|uniref:DUF3180 domain-containing protein n=1 Tax=Corynebacterium breve TaxID=3049799 RepID=A0ABY8VCK0_9CORY|nr:DUF3180 domain-containing protein [Corynebacterium breve]WIM67366.1 DUF3180 domain-containing protein [Corynebacterium breve]